jgi:hypothetical protein
VLDCGVVKGRQVLRDFLDRLGIELQRDALTLAPRLRLSVTIT